MHIFLKENRLILAIALILIIFQAHAQRPTTALKFESFGTESGLSDSGILSIFQDSENFLWVGTFSGLNRFDGNQFVTFTHHQADQNSISNDVITGISEDQDGFIWIATTNGLNKYDKTTGKFERFHYSPSEPNSLSSNTIYAVAVNDSNQVWLGTSNGLNIFDQNRNEFRKVPIKNHPELTIYTIHHVDNETWFGTSKGVFIYSHISNTVTKFGYPLLSSPGGNMVSKITSDREGAIYFGTHAGPVIYDRRNKTFIDFKDEQFGFQLPSKISSILVSRSNNTWIASVDGLSRFILKTGNFEHFSTETKSVVGLNTNHITQLFEDVESNLWVGTRDGLHKLTQFSLGVTQLNSELAPEVLGNNSVRVIKELDNQIVITAANANFIYHPSKSSFSTNQLTKAFNQEKLIYAIVKDNRENYWIGNDRGLHLYDKYFNFIKSFNKTNSNLKSNLVLDLLLENEHVWVGTYSQGLYKLDLTNHQIEKIETVSNTGYIPNTHVQKIILDHKNEIWVASWTGGLFKYDKEKNALQNIIYDFDKKINFNNIQFEDVSLIDNSLWFATSTGLIKFNSETLEAILFSEDSGISTKAIHGLVSDNNGSIWLATNRGLSKFDVDNYSTTNYGLADGLINNRLTVPPILTDDGLIITAGQQGLLTFDPQSVHKTSPLPSPKITEIFINNKPILVDHNYLSNAHHTDEYELIVKENKERLSINHHQVFFIIEFSAIQFANTTKNQYAYKLEGWDENWIYTDSNNRRATYTNIPAGEYTFKIKASNRDGAWSPIPAKLNITVLPAPWKTWWAYSLYILVVIIIVFFFILQANKRKAAEEQKKLALEISSTKDRLLANVSHEFRTPLTLILSPLDNIINTTENKENKERLKSIQRSAKRLLVMVDQMLDLAKLQGNKHSDRQLVDVLKTSSIIIDSFYSLAEELEIKLLFETQIHENIFVLMVPDAFEKIVINLLSNAFKYTPKGGEVLLTISLVNTDPSQVTVSVSDTGQGMSEKDQLKIFDRLLRLESSAQTVPGVGIGLALVKEIVDSHQGMISVTSQINIGSKFTVTLSRASATTGQSISNTTHVNKEYLEYSIDSFEQEFPQNKLAINPQQNISYDFSLKRYTILVVEDNRELRNYLKEILDRSYNILEASDGERGVEVATTEMPDLILSDVMMPKMNGFQLTEAIRANEATSHIPVIILTAKGDKKSRLYGWKQTADEYITKPFDNEDLLHRIENLLSIRKILSQRLAQEVLKENSIKMSYMDGEAASDSLEENLDLLKINFINRINTSLEYTYSDSSLTIADIAISVAMSERQLLRKFKSIMDMLPSEYLRKFRLSKAKNALTSGKRINEVAFNSGFTSQSYFSRCFKAEFGVSPKIYAKSGSVNDKENTHTE